MPTFVDDFTALISGASWSSGTGLPTVVTYSFEDEPAGYLSDTYGSGFLNSFESLTVAEEEIAREALEDWAAVSGIIFVEVAAGRGDIRFGSYDLSQNPETSGFSGFAYYPATSAWYRSGLGGDVFIDANRFSYGLLAHEIGHAIGLEHPHEGDLQLNQEVDNSNNTVMSYNVIGMRTELGPFDVDAAQHIYGPTAFTPSGNGGIADFDYDPDGKVVAQNWGYAASEIIGTSLRDDISGGDGDDTIGGHGRADTITGQSGNDFLLGHAGRDVLRGGAGSDTAFGGVGPDAIFGHGGNDWLEGGRHDDTLKGGAETDWMFGKRGNDRILGQRGDNWAKGGAGSDTILGQGGRDELIGGSARDELRGGAGSDTLRGNTGADTLLGHKGDDLFKGGRQNDRLLGHAGRDELRGGPGNETLQGNTGLDTLLGHKGDDLLRGGGQNDSVLGHGGDDTLLGGRGDDTLKAGAGGDVLEGRGGDDLLAGRPGADTFVFDTNRHTDNDTIGDFENGADLIRLDGPVGFGNLTIDRVGDDTLISWSNGSVLLEGETGMINEEDFVFG